MHNRPKTRFRRILIVGSATLYCERIAGLFADAEGPPSFKCEPPDADSYRAKLTWVNGHLERFFGEGTRFAVTEEEEK